jgi:LPLT family lysophospholipid transporter-like MFS transporter
MTANRNYRLLLASQFLGAFGDNAVLAVILGQLTFLQQKGQITSGQLSTANAVYTSLFFVPYVVMGPLAGFLNDRYAKTRWLLGGNLTKLAGTALAALSVWWGPFWQGLGYFIVGIGACVYSPAKYGILPEVVPRERLVKANGTIEFLTLAAILTGNVGGAGMIDLLPVTHCYAVLAAIFGISLALNALMHPTPAHPEVKVATSVDAFFSNFGDLLAHRRLFRVLCGTGMFWVCGAVSKMNFQPWGINVLKLEKNTQIALLGVWLSIGIMLGALLAGQLHRVGDLSNTRPYGWLFAAFIGVLGLLEVLFGAEFVSGWVPVVVMLILTGVAAGLFLIPLNAALQSECPQDKLGKTIATQNFVDNLAMVAAGGLVFMGARAQLSPSGVFLCLSVFVALVVTVLKVPPKWDAQRDEAEDWP